MAIKADDLFKTFSEFQSMGVHNPDTAATLAAALHIVNVVDQVNNAMEVALDQLRHIAETVETVVATLETADE